MENSVCETSWKLVENRMRNRRKSITDLSLHRAYMPRMYNNRYSNLEWKMVIGYSRVKNLTFMTTFWLRCFDDWFDFLEPFKKYLAPVSLAKIPAFFSRGVNPKWPPPLLWKNNFWQIKATIWINILFWLIRPQGIHFWRQYGIKTHFWP